MKRWRGESDLARFAGTGGKASVLEVIVAISVMSVSRKNPTHRSYKKITQRPTHAKMVLVASGRKEGSAVISTRELVCKSLHVCRKCRKGARDMEEIREHNRKVHK